MTRPITRGWKPGDVAVVISQYDREVVAIRAGTPTNMGWAYAEHLNGSYGNHWSSDPRGLRVVRPLVVIDPERLTGTTDGAAYIARLLREADENNGIPTFAALADEFDPPPPKPAEPTGLGAVVEDADGYHWVFRGGPQPAEGQVWYSPNLNGTALYGEITAVRVLSEGVPA